MPRAAPLSVLWTLLLLSTGKADDATGYVLPLELEASGAYYVRVGFADGSSSALLVDTGSTYVALSRKTFKRLERDRGTVFQRTIHGATASGRIMKVSVYSITSLTLADGCVLDDVEAVVLPGSDRDILGLSALRRLEDFAMDFEPPALRFAACRALDRTSPVAAAEEPLADNRAVPR